MPARKRSVTQHSTSRPKGELTTLQRAEYYDKWRALKDDIENTINDLVTTATLTGATSSIQLRAVLKRMDEYEDGTR